MGTSTSSKGPGSNSPLVPPWADKDAAGPGPVPAPQRFRAFRTSLGSFVRDGSTGRLTGAIGHYARTATGGAAVAPRRFGSMAQAGGALFDAVSALRSGQVAKFVDFSAIQGKDVKAVIEAISTLLTPADGDAERVRVALIEALSECLDGVEDFDFTSISDDMISEMMVNYLARCVFEQVMLDSRDAFTKADTVKRLEKAEADLWNLVWVAVDKHIGDTISSNVSGLSSADIENIQLKAIHDVWVEWEGYTR